MADSNMEERMAAYEKKVQRALDYMEIQNVFALHEYYHHKPAEEIDMIFAQKQPDVSFGQNQGMWVGLESVKKNYKGQSKEEQQKRLDALRKWHPDIPDDIKYAASGELGFHMLTTPLIEIAEDGQTAKGMWYTPGFMTMFNEQNGKWNAGWMFEKYLIDFIKEDGKWKIWHFNALCDFFTPYEKSWVESSEERRLHPEGAPMMMGDKRDVPSLGTVDYSTRRVQPMDFPKPPEPYRTFSETHSYGPART